MANYVYASDNVAAHRGRSERTHRIMGQAGNQAAWGSVQQGLIFNTDTAIAKYWSDLKSQGQYIGVPISGEVDTGDGGVEMAFSSGAVIRWHPDEGPSLQ